MIRFSAPKILHQIYKDKDLPEKMRECQEKWLNMFPEYLYKFYTYEDLRNVIEEYFPNYLSFYDSLTQTEEKVDFAKYAILHRFGGVYSDLNIIPLKSLDNFLEQGKVILGRKPLENSNEILCKIFMISPPADPYWITLMDYIIKEYKPYQNAVYTTGPMIMTKLLEENPDAYKEVVITNPCVFFPITNKPYSHKTQGGFEHVSKYCDINEAYAAHLWNDNGSTISSIITYPLNWCMILILILIIFYIIFKLCKK